jgi:hypothetical protein
LRYSEAFLGESKENWKVIREKLEFNDELVKEAIEKYFKKEVEDIASIRTSSQFLTMWKAIKSDEKTQKAFLLAYDPTNLPGAFKSGMDFGDFSSLVKALEYFFFWP